MGRKHCDESGRVFAGFLLACFCWPLLSVRATQPNASLPSAGMDGENAAGNRVDHDRELVLGANAISHERSDVQWAMLS